MFNIFKQKAIVENKTLGKPKMKIYGSAELSPTIDEAMSELRPPEGLNKFKNMEDNEPIIGGLMLRLKNIMKNASWEIEGPNASLVRRQIEELPYGMIGLIEDMTSAFTFGFSLNELVWKSEGSEIMLSDISPRYQPTIQEFLSAKSFDNVDQIYARQMTTDKGTVDIPLSKCLHFVPIQRCRNPYGKSFLRSAYKPYYYKASIEASEAQGIDRSLSGLPVLTAPEGFDFVNADEESPSYDAYVAATLDWAENVVSKVRKDEMQGIVKPFGWELTLLKGETSVTVNSPEILSRYNVEIAVALLQNFAVMGGFASTNNSNIEEMINDFKDSCSAFLNCMGESISKQVFKRICWMNFKEKYPKMIFHALRKEDLSDLAGFAARLVDKDVIGATDGLERRMLERINVPYKKGERQALLDERERRAQKQFEQQESTKQVKEWDEKKQPAQG